VLTDVVTTPASVDWMALRWHVMVQDMWFLVWNVLLDLTAWCSWRESGALAREGGRDGRAREGNDNNPHQA
jgi:hypothetical protein